MRIYGTFKDKNNNNISVNIYNINKTGADVNIDTCDWIRFSDEPVIITTDCEDSFTHIIKKQCKIELISKRWLGDYLFANNATSIVVNVKRQVNNKIECLFAGFVTPCTYNQDYANAWEKITINCIDNLGVMEYRSQTDESTWADLKARSAMRTFKYLLEKMKLNDTTINIGNLPNTQYAQTAEMKWVETTYERKVDTDGNITYYAVETNVKILDADTAVTTTETRTGNELTPTYIQSEDVVFVDGTPHYKKYAWLEINGELVKTNDYIIGDVATDLLPTVVDTINVLDGWTYGAMPQPFEYYEHFRIDNKMSDGSIARGSSDTIGDRIPEKPQQTTLGSFFEFRQGDADDLYEDEDQRGKYYYKNYAWVIMEFDNKSWQFKTGDWKKGRIYGSISGKIVANPTNNGLLPALSMNQRSYVAHIDSTTGDFYYNVDYDPNNTRMFFYEPNGDACFENVEELYFNNVDTSNITNMYEPGGGWRGLLADFINLETVDLTKINISSLTSTGFMFNNCSSLTSIDLSNFDTSNVTSMPYMFNNCSSLTSLDVTNFNTSNVTNMTAMFANCSSLTSLDVTNFNTSNVTNMTAMFANCSGLTSIDVSNFDTSSGTHMYHMFRGCSGLTSLDLSNFDTSNVTEMEEMFRDCRSLTSIDLSSFDTSNVPTLAGMFKNCRSLTSLDLSNFNTSNMQGMHGTVGGFYEVFYECVRLTTLNLSNFIISTGADVRDMFYRCNSLTTLVLNNVNNDTFNMITASNAHLPTTCKIYRDGDVYEYNNNTNKWIAN